MADFKLNIPRSRPCGDRKEKALLGPVAFPSTWSCAVASTLCLALLLGPPPTQAFEGAGSESDAAEKETPELVDAYGRKLPRGAFAQLETRQLKHAAQVTCVRFSPDGRSLASGSYDRTVRIWDVATGKQRQLLTGHTAYVLSVAFSPDGRRLASGSQDSTVRIWDVETGRLLRTLSGHSSYVYALAFSPDGKLLASGGRDSTIRVWNPGNGQTVRQIHGHTSYVYALDFSPDGELLASGGRDRTLRVFNHAESELVAEGVGHSSYLLDVEWLPGGKQIVTASQDKTIKTWDARSGRLLRTLQGHSSYVQSLARSSDGHLMVSGSRDKTIKLWDPVEGKPIRHLATQSGYAQSVDMTADGATIASADGISVRIWETATGQDRHPVEAVKLEANSIACSADGQWMVVGSEDGNIRVLDPRGVDLTSTLIDLPSPVHSVAAAPDGSLAASASRDRTLRIWELPEGKERHQLTHKCRGYGVVFSPDSRSVVAQDEITEHGVPLRLLRQWDVESGALIREFRLPNLVALRLAAFSPDGAMLATRVFTAKLVNAQLTAESQVVLWDVPSGKLLKTLAEAEPLIDTYTFSDTGTSISKSPDITERGWTLKLAGGLMGLRPPEGMLAFSCDGTRLLGAGSGHDLDVWDVESGTRIDTLGIEALSIVLVDGPQEPADLPGSQPGNSSSADETRADVLADRYLLWGTDAWLLDHRRARQVNNAATIEGWWKSLTEQDAVKAYHASWLLIDTPRAALDSAAEWIQPVAQPPDAVLRLLLQDLDDEEYAVREQATKQLETLGPLAVPALEQALSGIPSPEVVGRVRRLLNELAGAAATPRERQSRRAVEVLERIGTPPAIELLERMAGGAPAARETLAAQAALSRLGAD